MLFTILWLDQVEPRSLTAALFNLRLAIQILAFGQFFRIAAEDGVIGTIIDVLAALRICNHNAFQVATRVQDFTSHSIIVEAVIAADGRVLKLGLNCEHVNNRWLVGFSGGIMRLSRDPVNKPVQPVKRCSRGMEIITSNP